MDLESYTCVDCNQEKPKAQFFNSPNPDSAYQKKSYKCNDCRDSYAKRYYDTKLKVTGLRNRSIIALDTIVSKIKTPTTSKDYLIDIMLDALFKQLNADDVEAFKHRCQTKIEAVQRQR